jgi:hypothetical protein
MSIVGIEPGTRFTGLDKDGWLVYPNLYHCPHCGYGVYFNQSSLEAGAFPADADTASLEKLDVSVRSEFAAPVAAVVSAHPGSFVLAFHCPKCEAPVAICFDATEAAMSYLRFKPVRIFEREEPNNAMHATCEDARA